MEEILSPELVDRMIVVNKLFNPRARPGEETVGLVLIVVERTGSPTDTIKVVTNGITTEATREILRGLLDDMDENNLVMPTPTPPRN